MRSARLVSALVLILVLVGCGSQVESQPAQGEPAAVTAPAVSTETAVVTETVAPETESPAPATVEQLIREVRSGVIRVQVQTCDGLAEGTGILVGPRLVATAEHVVAGATGITLKQQGKKVGAGIVIGYDVERDVALIRSTEPISGYEFDFANRAPRLGEDVAAIGFPVGLPLTVTRGLVSGLNRNLEIEGVRRRRLVQFDAAVNPGNSGGPLVSVPTHEVLGIVSAGSLELNAIAFATPSRTARSLVAAWADSPQPVTAESCSSPSVPPPVSSTQVGYEGYFASVDRLETCYADDSGAACAAQPSGKGAILEVGVGASYLGIVDSTDQGGEAMALGTSFTTPAGTVTCSSSTRGITCTDNTTGAYFVIGDHDVKVNNGGGEEGY